MQRFALCHGVLQRNNRLVTCWLVSYHAASVFIFFLRFLRFFLGFVGASAESLPGPLALDWTAILLCFGSLPVFVGQP